MAVAFAGNSTAIQEMFKRRHMAAPLNSCEEPIDGDVACTGTPTDSDRHSFKFLRPRSSMLKARKSCDRISEASNVPCSSRINSARR